MPMGLRIEGQNNASELNYHHWDVPIVSFRSSCTYLDWNLCQKIKYRPRLNPEYSTHFNIYISTNCGTKLHYSKHLHQHTYAIGVCYIRSIYIFIVLCWDFKFTSARVSLLWVNDQDTPQDTQTRNAQRSIFHIFLNWEK